MMDDILQFIWSRIGLIFNFAGTILIAFSFGKNRGEANQNDDKGRKTYLASFLYPGLFKIGISLIILGFLLQIIFPR